MAITLVATSHGAHQHGVSLPPVDTTGATLLVVSVSWYIGGGTTPSSVSDSFAQSLTPLTTRTSGTVASRIYYLANPTVGPGHQIFVPGVNIYCVATLWAFAGADTYEVENGAAATSGTSLATGSVTPAANGALIVSGWAGYTGTSSPLVDAGLTLTTSQNPVGGLGGNIAGGHAYKIQAVAAAINPTWTWTGSDHAAAAIAVFTGSATIAAPVDYEDPCTITQPRIFQSINIGTELLKVSPHPLRDTAAMGGFAEPRLLEVGPISRIGSDPVTGAWSAQSASTRWADTDRATRARSEARTSFRNCETELYLTSNARRLAGLPPRVVFAGVVYADTAEENLVHSHALNDLIGSQYSLSSEEKQIPQRTVETNWFPFCPVQTLGVGEPIVGGRRAPLDPAVNGEGVSEGIYVGPVLINSVIGTPDASTLAAVVAALNASGATGTIYADWGSRIGYADANILQSYYDSHSTVPTDYDGLAQIIGYSDLDALLAGQSHSGGTWFEGVLVASHAITQILNATNGNPSVWINENQVPLADLGVHWWAPQIAGDTSWASDIGADAFTDIVGLDGRTRRYTLILFEQGSALATSVMNGGRVHLDLIGLEDEGDGTGAALTDYFALYRHVLVNFILQDYQSGAWLPVPQFTYSDGSTLIDRVDADSFDVASAVAALSLAGGRLGSFTITDRTSVRDVIATFNLCGGGRLAEDDFGRLRAQVLDVRRSNFLTNALGVTRETALRDKVDILPGFWIEPKPDWQTNLLRYAYAHHGYTGKFERGDDGSAAPTKVEDATSQARDGVLKKTIALPYVTDDATAQDVATYYLELFKNLPHVVHYSRRGLCGLEDDVLDGRAITHYNGYGADGWIDHAVWILSKTFQPRAMYCEFTALDVEARIAQDETVELVALLQDPVGGDTLIADGTGEELVADP